MIVLTLHDGGTLGINPSRIVMTRSGGHIDEGLTLIAIDTRQDYPLLVKETPEEIADLCQSVATAANFQPEKISDSPF